MIHKVPTPPRNAGISRANTTRLRNILVKQCADPNTAELSRVL